MTPFLKHLRELRDRLLGRWYEGPDPPARYGDMALEFADSRRRAQRQEWVEFAKGLAEEAYKAGYVRGYEASDRDFDRVFPHLKPETIADFETPEWRWSKPVQFIDPLADVPDDAPLDEVQEVDEFRAH